jgi:AcrR family transcriptional regulator
LARKEEILDALIVIFRKQGIESDFTMSQLAKEVNIGKSTIYEYFKTKDEVLQQAICRVVDEAVDSIQNREVIEGNFEELFKYEVYTLFNIALSSRFLFNLITPGFKKQMNIDHRKEMSDKVSGVSKFYKERFMSIFMKGVVEGKLNPILLEENNLVITSMVTGSILTLANSNVDIEENLNVKEYIEKVFAAIIKLSN